MRVSPVWNPTRFKIAVHRFLTLVDAEQYWLESRVCHAISGDHISATGSVDSALSFPYQGLSADESYEHAPRVAPRSSRTDVITEGEPGRPISGRTKYRQVQSYLADKDI